MGAFAAAFDAILKEIPQKGVALHSSLQASEKEVQFENLEGYKRLRRYVDHPSFRGLFLHGSDRLTKEVKVEKNRR